MENKVNNRLSRKIALFIIVICITITSMPVFSMPVSISNKADEENLVKALIAEAGNFGSTIELEKYNIPVETAAYLSSILWLEPELYVYNAQTAYSYTSKGGKLYSITGLARRFSSKSELDAARKFFSDECKKIIDQIDPSYSELEKVIFVNTYLCNYYEYDFTYKNYDAYSMLKEGKGVCQAYSLLARALFNLLGIETDAVYSDSMKHEWLKIKLGGKWYHLDITHNDPTGTKPGSVTYKNFLLSDSGIVSSNHSSDFSAVLTADDCTSTTYDNYFWRDVKTPLVEINGSWYYMASVTGSGNICNNIMKTNDFVSFETFFEKKDIWYTSAEKKSYWQGVFTGLGAVGRFLIYNTMYELVALDTTTKQKTVIYNLSISGNDGIFGSQVKEDKINIFVQDATTLGNPSAAYSTISIDVPKFLTEEATPTPEPTATPTAKPTATPTAKPTATPTAKPTATPTAKPTAKPTATPTAKPTATPTAKPTATPTAKPTATPTAKPTATPEPTENVTATPTQEPTATPTAKPTETPTPTGVATPTGTPDVSPTPSEDYGDLTELADQIQIEQNLIYVPQGTKCGLLLQLLNGQIRDIYGNIPNNHQILGTGYMIETNGSFFTIVILGDLDGDGVISVDDAIYLSYAVEDSEMYPLCYDCDFNKDGTVDRKDAIELLKSIIDPELYGVCYEKG